MNKLVIDFGKAEYENGVYTFGFNVEQSIKAVDVIQALNFKVTAGRVTDSMCIRHGDTLTITSTAGGHVWPCTFSGNTITSQY